MDDKTYTYMEERVAKYQALETKIRGKRANIKALTRSLPPSKEAPAYLHNPYRGNHIELPDAVVQQIVDFWEQEIVALEAEKEEI